ncbi:alpha-1,3-rhamnosyltransferase [Chryseobacterium oleae]|uniref:Alpha-1,3-rhamnosyltransferase n=1 Tax=Chryseobacterium oleae TaxID=491207 RepID=A0A1I4ZDU5_CHROL|nr:glycosyltransferase [Chryseobacterium oleae]SFN48050.1 alpha-1,3-rhamnosyltransferase [Chryseobacterium oleae]
MEQPLVTVVVVSYNHSKFIKENLDSIKNQTYSNIQLIVGDDASPDNSADIMDQWLTENNYSAEKNFHAQNTGLATMLNECVALAKGKYIKLIAADDFLHPEAIEKSVSKLENLGEDYGMIFTDTFAVNESSAVVQDVADYNKTGNVDPLIFRQELIKGNRIPALTVMMRTEAVRETGKYDSTFIVEDYYRWLKINEKYLIAYIPEKLAYYRIHTDNISKTRAERIDLEFAMLQTMFDKEGKVRHKINGFIQQKYFLKKEIPAEFFILYKNYPFHIKRLVFCIQNHIPPMIYKIACKFI